MLQTSRCVMEEASQSDHEDIKELYLNREVRKFLGGPRELDGIAGIMDGMSETGTRAWYFCVRERETEKFIGVVSLDLYHSGQHMEVPYQFLPEWWGNGYAFESVGRVIQFAFENLRLPAIVAETQTANAASCRLLEKLGMRWIDSFERFGAQQSLYAIDSDRFFSESWHISLTEMGVLSE